MSEGNCIVVFVYTGFERIDLRTVLRSVKKFASEVFVIEASCHVETIEMAKVFGVRVLHPPLECEARQFQWALDTVAITADWIMLLRAGEFVEADLVASIRLSLAAMPEDITGVYLNRKVTFQGKRIRWGGECPMWVLRLWRAGKETVEDRWTGEYVQLAEGRRARFPVSSSINVQWNADSLAQTSILAASWEALETLRRRLRVNQCVRGNNWLQRMLVDHVPYILCAAAAFFYRYIILLGFLDRRAGLTYFLIRFFGYQLLVGANLKQFEGTLGRVTDEGEASRKLQALADRIAAHKRESDDVSTAYRDLLR